VRSPPKKFSRERLKSLQMKDLQMKELQMKDLQMKELQMKDLTSLREKILRRTLMLGMHFV